MPTPEAIARKAYLKELIHLYRKYKRAGCMKSREFTFAHTVLMAHSDLDLVEELDEDTY